jgi:hypothetical protein
MVLLRLQPDQISKYWDVVRYTLAVSVPPITKLTDRYFVKCLEALLAGKMQVWVFLEKVVATKLNAMVITEIVGDPLSGTKSLLVFAGATFEVDPNLKEWKAATIKLMRFAKANNCVTMTSYVNNPRLMEIYKKIGICSEYFFVEIDLNKPL